MSLVSIVIPAYNEETRLGPTLGHITEYFQGRNGAYEIVASDDGSVDRTRALVRAHARRDARTRLIEGWPNRGKGSAVRRGMLAAAGDVVLMTDADLSTPIEDFERLVAWIHRGHDIAIGSRKLPGAKVEVPQPLHRSLLGRGFSWLSRQALSTPIYDFTCGFKCFTRHAVHQVFKRAVIDDWSYDAEILFIANRLGLRIKEEPVRWRDSSDSRVRLVRDLVGSMIGLARIRRNGVRRIYRFDA